MSSIFLKITQFTPPLQTLKRLGLGVLCMLALVAANAPRTFAACIPVGESTSERKLCCSRYTIPKVTYCPGGTNCQMVCGTRPVTDSPCIPPGGIDDIPTWSNCCTGRAVPGSYNCLDPADATNGTHASCYHTCAP